MSKVSLPQLVSLPGGAFRMGNDAGRSDEQPAHDVSVGPFRVALSPVTNAEYALFLQSTGHEAPPFLDDERFNPAEQPVVGIGWFDAQDYCRWLSWQTGALIRLPTEAEREYAALGGLEGGIDWPWGDQPPESQPALAHIVKREQPHAPGIECANGYGLLCMVDNVHEWCSDWFDAAYYAVSPVESPPGPETGRRRASRGGAWRHQIKFNRIAARSSLDPSFHYNDYGFRVYADA